MFYAIRISIFSVMYECRNRGRKAGYASKTDWGLSRLRLKESGRLLSGLGKDWTVGEKAGVGYIRKLRDMQQENQAYVLTLPRQVYFAFVSYDPHHSD
jgi:hypothetical protein